MEQKQHEAGPSGVLCQNVGAIDTITIAKMDKS